jgi:hypothetical protein
MEAIIPRKNVSQAGNTSFGTSKKKQKGAGTKKFDRNRTKCARYRARVGKPNGKGVPGNKRGKNKR